MYAGPVIATIEGSPFSVSLIMYDQANTDDRIGSRADLVGFEGSGSGRIKK